MVFSFATDIWKKQLRHAQVHCCQTSARPAKFELRQIDQFAMTAVGQKVSCPGSPDLVVTLQEILLEPIRPTVSRASSREFRMAVRNMDFNDVLVV